MANILFLAHRMPFPPNRGDKIRSAHILRKLAQIGPVHVGCFAETDEDRRAIAELAELAASHCVVHRKKPLAIAGIEAVLSGKPVSQTAFHSSAMKRWVRDTIRTQGIDTIVVFSGQMGQYLPEKFDGRVIIDLCDVDSAKFESYARSGMREWIYEREGRLLAREEERLSKHADTTLLISENEAQLFRSRLEKPSQVNVKVIGNGIDASFFDPSQVSPNQDILRRPGPHFVFTGQMDYPPNEAAALWAIEHFLPAIRKSYGEAEFHVVGRNPTAALRGRSRLRGVTVWGEVSDVRPFLAAATCVLAPLLIARGVQNKVLEAMAMARPVMLTPEAATGIDARDGEHWLVCDPSPEPMCRRLEIILRDEYAPDLGKSARQFVLEKYDWNAMLEPLELLVLGRLREARDAA